MLTAAIRSPDGRISHDASPAALEAALRDPSTLFWLDMASPTEDEYKLLETLFHFHPLAIEDSRHHVQRPKIESYDHPDGGAPGPAARPYIYMVFHGPDLETYHERLRLDEIDIFACDRYLVTIHDKPFKSCQDLLARTQSDPNIVLEPGIDRLLYLLLDRIVDNYEPILDQLEEAIDDLEERAMASPGPEVLNAISHRKRELLNLRRIVGPQREVIAQLTRGEVPFVREPVRVYLRDVHDHLTRVVEMVELYRDLVSGARDIYLSSISNNLNQIMKTLTIFSVIALPMTVITGFFGMNFESIPGLHSRNAFWITVAAMAVMVTGMLMFFRHKRWL